MPISLPVPLLENAGLAYVGEPVWPPATLMEREATELMDAVNACGRPNADVLRRRLAVVHGAPDETWQVDFPPHFTPQEAALYERPLRHLQRRSGGIWHNPHANPDLRRALARVSRFLATPAEVPPPDWRWIEDELLPDATLLVVPRDDDFTRGVLSGEVFAQWHQAYHAKLGAAPSVTAFPFPWAPTTPLSSLNPAQEEQRHAIARAARANDAARIDAAVLAAYGWPTDLPPAELLEKLLGLNHARAGSGT
ncbi:MAG TPA: hypothetical protein VHN79_13000 [Lacunisphaera sp.]|nr:hypothetical protein [Lacunisphaera sp.]